MWQKIILWIRNNIFNLIIISVLITIIICGYLFVIRPVDSIGKNYKQLLDNQQRIEQVTKSISGILADVSKNTERIGKTIADINGTIGSFQQFGNSGTAGSAEAQKLINDQRRQLQEAKRILESATTK